MLGARPGVGLHRGWVLRGAEALPVSLHPRRGFPCLLRPPPAGAAVTAHPLGCRHSAAGLQHACCGGRQGGSRDQGCPACVGAPDCGDEEIEAKIPKVSCPPLAAPGGHQLPQWAHRPALGHHCLPALWGLAHPNLHLHSGEHTPSPPPEGALSPPRANVPPSE